MDPLANSSEGIPSDFPKVVSTDFGEVATELEITLFIIAIAVFEVLVETLRKYKPFKYIPETCYLITLGLGLGAVLIKGLNHGELSRLITDDVFFLILLPPIVFEAGYKMPRYDFMSNIGTILVFAIMNTLFNAILIGGSMKMVYQWGWCEKIPLSEGSNEYVDELSITVVLLFGSIIAAVDPVAVIAVFDEIHVNSMLFICVFGESLLNDGVAVVLFQAFEKLLTHTPENITIQEVLFLVVEFAYVAFGGILVGLILAYFVCIATKYWPRSFSIFEPVVVYLLPYLAYLIGEYLEMSSILAIVTCGFIMQPHVEANITRKSNAIVDFTVHLFSHVTEVIIFIWLGIVSFELDWRKYFNPTLALWVLLFCSVYRLIGVLGFSFICNYFREVQIPFKDQLVSSFGGLRGGIAFSLIVVAPITEQAVHDTLTLCTIFVVLFTSFVQGILVEPLVTILKNDRAPDNSETNLITNVSDAVIDNFSLVLQGIVGEDSRKSNLVKYENWWHRNLWDVLRRTDIAGGGLDRWDLVNCYYKTVESEFEEQKRLFLGIIEKVGSENGGFCEKTKVEPVDDEKHDF